MSKTPWFVSHTVRRSPSQLATEPCVSSGVWISQGVLKVLSTTTCASANPVRHVAALVLLGVAAAVAALVHGGRARLQRFRVVHHEGQLLVLDRHGAHRVARLLRRVRGHRGHLLALVAAVRVEEQARWGPSRRSTRAASRRGSRPSGRHAHRACARPSRCPRSRRARGRVGSARSPRAACRAARGPRRRRRSRSRARRRRRAAAACRPPSSRPRVRARSRSWLTSPRRA